MTLMNQMVTLLIGESPLRRRYVQFAFTFSVALTLATNFDSPLTRSSTGKQRIP